MSRWHLFTRDDEDDSPDPSTKARLEAKVKELQREMGIDDNALRALQRRLQMEIEMLEKLRDAKR